MIDLFNLVFYSFWTFAGTTILLGIVVQGAVALAAIVAGRKS